MSDAAEPYPLPDGWVWTTLAGTAEINPRKSVPSDLTPDSLVTFLPMPAVDAYSGTIATPEDRPLSEVSRGFTNFHEGDVLFAKITPSMENGKAAIARDLTNSIGFGSTEFHVLRPSEDVIPEWLFHYIRQTRFRADAKANFSGTAGQLRVPSDFIHNYPLPLAPLPEQRRIVDEIETQFSRLDAAEAALKRVQSNLKRYRVSVLKSACEGCLVPTEAELARAEGREYEPASVLVERILTERRAKWQAANPKKAYKEPAAPNVEELPELPEGWVWATVGQLAEVGTGATPYRGRPEYYENGTVPWVTSKVVGSRYVDEANEMITESALHETNAKVFEPGTLLVAMYGEGKTRGGVTELRISAATNQALAALVLAPADAILKEYLKIFLQMNYDNIRRLSSGGVQPNLNLSIIKDTIVPLPPAAEQIRIIGEAESHLARIGATNQTTATNLQRVNRLRQSLLRGAFTGRLLEKNSAR